MHSTLGEIGGLARRAHDSDDVRGPHSTAQQFQDGEASQPA
ncbi:hypothetical protein RAM_33400 [Amycolatopsis mediterranei S699]|uniref:Uncharacterized protein n=1 Tax=Amycolatopsis mediterranei (strain S699) TaxID=713604 RepID=A0A9R0P2N3_AMYMS|nr:hypothetical protein RAM_33400 [Amycolatopsis mediterranei S699]